MILKQKGNYMHDTYTITILKWTMHSTFTTINIIEYMNTQCW